MLGALRIGELASAAGVSTDAVRYYERLKILPRPGRTRAGYRLYSEEDVARLRFIKQAQSLGLSLDEIKELLPGRGAGLPECLRVRDLLAAKLAELDTKIAEMRRFRKTLSAYLSECEEALAGRRGDCCPVLFEITQTIPRKSKPGRKAVKSKALLMVVSALIPAALAYYSGASLQAQTRSTSTEKSGVATVTISISGMSCGSCAMQIKSELAKSAGVKSANVSYEKGQAVVRYDSNATSAEAIRGVIESLNGKEMSRRHRATGCISFKVKRRILCCA